MTRIAQLVQTKDNTDMMQNSELLSKQIHLFPFFDLGEAIFKIAHILCGAAAGPVVWEDWGV